MSPLVIDASRIAFSYEKMSILQIPSLSIKPGEFIGIIGPNGGGKTTLLKLIMGFLTPQEGKLLLFGASPLETRRRIGYVPQVSHVDRDFPITVLELILLGWPGKSIFYPRQAKREALQLIDELGLASHQFKAFSSLSGGLAQRALLARALLSKPDLLLLDEPTANVDPVSRTQILNRLALLKGKKTILLVTHDLQTIVQHVNRILCVQNQVSSYLPNELCEHFALGLYHTPLIKSPITRETNAAIQPLSK